MGYRGGGGGSSTFQKIMNTILKPVSDKDTFVYLDDITEMTETYQEHVWLLREVFMLLQNAGLSTKFEKRKIFRKKESI